MMSPEPASSGGSGPQNLPGQTNIDKVLKSETVRIERKDFVLTLKRNRRGRFLRISEKIGGHLNNIIIPGAGLRELRRIIDDMLNLPDDSSRA